MSLKNIRTVVENFINGPRNDLLVLKGDWGVGKSYFWNEVITKLRIDRVFEREYYSRVSVFGLNSLDELKTAIAVSRVELRADRRSDSVNKNIAKLLKHVEAIPALEKYVGSSIGSLLQATITDTLICIDDIERRGDRLAVKDILGLASLLKEERNCKIVLIVNEDALDETSAQEFKAHGEKIIDRQVKFSLSAEESVGCVFQPTDTNYDLINNSVSALGITNIRILQRIHHSIEDLRPFLRLSERNTIDEVLRSLILYTWSYYGEPNGAPPLEFVLNYSTVKSWLKKEQKIEAPPEEKKWSKVLATYDYFRTDEIDTHLAQFVRTGYVERAEFDSLLEKRNQHHKFWAQDVSYREAWAPFASSFDDDEAPFVAGLLAACRANVNVIAPREVQGVVETLRQLGRDEEADSLIEDYVSARSSDKDIQAFVALTHSAFWDEVNDPHLVTRLRALIAPAQQDRRTLQEVIEPICLKNGWNPNDIPRLDSFSANEYYKFFKTYKGESLQWCVKKCLEIGSNTGHNGMYESIGQKTKEALVRIARESNLNKLRVESVYKLEIPHAETAEASP